MGTGRDSDGFSDEGQLEESFDSNEDEKPHGSVGDEDEDEKELEESFDSNEDEKPHDSEGNEYEDNKELEEGFDFNEDEKPHGSEGDEGGEELEGSFDSKEGEKPRDSDGDEDKELGVRFDFIGDEKPCCSDDDELTDSEEISTPSTSPPKGEKKSIQNRISASPAKQPKEARDRISILQDSLLIRILSFLPTKDAVRTGILSKRWQYLWTSVENISLKYRYSSYATDEKRAQKFITFVDKALVLFTFSDIMKFSLDFKYERRFAPNVNLWVRFAMQKNVEELELNLYNR